MAEAPSFTPSQNEAVKNQLGWYLCAQNILRPDKYLLANMRGPEMWVPVKLLANFPKIKEMTTDQDLIVSSLRELNFVIVSQDGEFVRSRNAPYLISEQVLFVQGPKSESQIRESLTFPQGQTLKIISDRDTFLVECANAEMLAKVQTDLDHHQWNVRPTALRRTFELQQQQQQQQQQQLQQQQQQFQQMHPMYMYQGLTGSPFPPYYPMQMFPSAGQTYAPQIPMQMYMQEPMMMQLQPQYSTMDTHRISRPENPRHGSGDRRHSRSQNSGQYKDKNRGRSRENSKGRGGMHRYRRSSENTNSRHSSSGSADTRRTERFSQSDQDLYTQFNSMTLKSGSSQSISTPTVHGGATQDRSMGITTEKPTKLVSSLDSHIDGTQSDRNSKTWADVTKTGTSPAVKSTNIPNGTRHSSNETENSQSKTSVDNTPSNMSKKGITDDAAKENPIELVP
eukprot:gene5884-7303_t